MWQAAVGDGSYTANVSAANVSGANVVCRLFDCTVLYVCRSTTIDMHYIEADQSDCFVNRIVAFVGYRKSSISHEYVLKTARA